MGYFRKLISRLYKYCFPAGYFYTPERKTNKEQDIMLSEGCKELIINEALLLLADIYISMSEHKQLYECQNIQAKVTEAEIEKAKRKGVEEFFDMIREKAGSDSKQKFDKHQII